MSIKSVGIWAPSPSTERGKSTQLSVDSRGERLAYTNNKSVFLRSIENPAISTQYSEHNAAATVARFSPSGYYVASGDVTGSVRIWDCVGEGGTRGTYQITRSLNDLAWDGESQRIIAVGDGKERFGHCITADSGNSVGEISGHTAQINCVSIRQQRPFRATTGSDDTSIGFFHGAPYKFNTSLRGQHNRYIYGTAFSPDGSLLVSVGADKKIWLYDGKTGEVKSQIGENKHIGSIFGVSWAKDSKSFVTSSADQTIKTWDAESGKIIQQWRLGDEGVVSIPDHQVGVVWTPRPDNLIISLSLSGNLNYLDPSTSKPRHILYGQQKNITALTSVPSSPTIFIGSSDGRITSFSNSDGKASPVDGDAHANYISFLSSTPTTISSTSWDDTLRTIDPSALTFVGTKHATDGQPRGVAHSGNHTIVATHKGLEVFSTSNSTRTSSLSTKYSSLCLAASPSSPLIATGGDDASLHIYDLSSSDSLSELKSLPTDGSLPSTLSFSPNGDMLAAGHANGKITVYSTKDWGVAISRWSSHTGKVTGISWRADGRYAVSGALDTSVFVWSVEKPGKRVSVGAAHKEGVNGVVWLEAGGKVEERVVSAGMDAAVKVWKVEGLE